MATPKKPQAVSTGYASARDYFHTAVTPAYSRFLGIKSRENAYEVANKIWNQRDWLWRDTHPGANPRNDKRYEALTAEIFAGCAELELIRDVAEGTKHAGELFRPGVKVRAITGAGSPGGTQWVTGPLGTLEGTPECTLALELVDGTSRRLPEVLEVGMRFWRERLS